MLVRLVLLVTLRRAVSAGATSAPVAQLAHQVHISQDQECPIALNAWAELFQTLALHRSARAVTLGLFQPTERLCAPTAQQASSPQPPDAPCQTAVARTVLQECSRLEVAWVTRELAQCAQQAPMLWKDPPHAQDAQQENI